MSSTTPKALAARLETLADGVDQRNERGMPPIRPFEISAIARELRDVAAQVSQLQPENIEKHSKGVMPSESERRERSAQSGSASTGNTGPIESSVLAGEQHPATNTAREVSQLAPASPPPKQEWTENELTVIAQALNGMLLRIVELKDDITGEFDHAYYDRVRAVALKLRGEPPSTQVVDEVAEALRRSGSISKSARSGRCIV